MEVSKKELEQILARQANRVAKESDKRMDKRFERWLQESDRRMERYIGGLKEDFDHKIDAVFEYVKDIPIIQQKQDVMFEQIGAMAEDIVVIKAAVKDHERRLQKSESR